MAALRAGPPPIHTSPPLFTAGAGPGAPTRQPKHYLAVRCRQSGLLMEFCAPDAAIHAKWAVRAKYMYVYICICII